LDLKKWANGGIHMAEEFGGTSLGSSKSGSSDDLDALIKETLEENKKVQAPKKEELSSGFKATHISIAPKPAPRPVSAPVMPPSSKRSETLAPKSPAVQAEEAAYEATFKSYKTGDIVKGTVVKVDPSGVLVDINYKSDGFIPPSELSDKSFSNINDIVKIGDKIDVLIEKLEDKEGYIVLSRRKAEYENKWRIVYDVYKTRRAIEAKVTSAVKGGLVVDYNGIRGFIPASQVAKETEDQIESLVGKTIPIKIIEINRRQGKVIMSHKIAAGEKVRPDTSKVFEDLEVGQVKHGAVTSLKNFGAFVDIGGVEGLIHLTELSWKRVNHPSDLLKVGQELDVFVLGVDKENKKVALGLKELQPDPWVGAAELYKPGQIVKAKIARFVKFGAFAELDGNLEGLIHISEISDQPIIRPEDVIKVGEIVDVKVLKVLPEEQKIGLSIKEAKKHEEKKETEGYAAPEKKAVTIGDAMKDKEHKHKNS
jgi:small subunit ribosomal protein S1